MNLRMVLWTKEGARREREETSTRVCAFVIINVFGALHT